MTARMADACQEGQQRFDDRDAADDYSDEAGMDAADSKPYVGELPKDAEYAPTNIEPEVIVKAVETPAKPAAAPVEVAVVEAVEAPAEEPVDETKAAE